jgi:excisionase family DNA binding protein
MVDNENNGNNGRSGGLLTVRDVAFLLHVHANTVRRWSDIGVLKSYRISSRGDRRFKREDIDQFLVSLSRGCEEAEAVSDADMLCAGAQLSAHA